MHVVHCDLMVGLPRALDGSTAILLLYDGFSRFTYGIALTSEKADYCVKKLMTHFIAAFGLPWALTFRQWSKCRWSFNKAFSLNVGSSQNFNSSTHP
jgi:hypothetical protein